MFDTKKAGFIRPAKIFNSIQLSNTRRLPYFPLDDIMSEVFIADTKFDEESKANIYEGSDL